jgi:hypothetical protein
MMTDRSMAGHAPKNQSELMIGSHFIEGFGL